MTINPIPSYLTRGFNISKPPTGLTSVRPFQEYPADIMKRTNLTNVNGGVLAGVHAVLTGNAHAFMSSDGRRVSVTLGGSHIQLQTDDQLNRTIISDDMGAVNLTALALVDLLLEPGGGDPHLQALLRAAAPAATTPNALNTPELAQVVIELTALAEQHLITLGEDKTITFTPGTPATPRQEITQVFRGEEVRVAPRATPNPGGTDLVVRLSRWIRGGQNVLLTGPTATFKTTDALTAATNAQAYIVMVGGRPGMEDRDLFGGTYPTPQGPQWVDGPVTEAFAKASSGTLTALVLNELTRFEPLHLGAMIGALDDVSAKTAQQMGVNVPDDDTRYYALRLPNGELIHCPTQFLSVIGTTNIGSDYLTAQEIDTALLRRFHRHEDVPYADEARAQAMIARGNDPILASAAYQLEVATRSQVQGRGMDEEGLLQREMNPAVSHALAQEATELAREGLNLNEAFRQAAECTCIPFCVPRLPSGVLDPAAAERLRDLITEIAQTL